MFGTDPRVLARVQIVALENGAIQVRAEGPIPVIMGAIEIGKFQLVSQAQHQKGEPRIDIAPAGMRVERNE